MSLKTTAIILAAGQGKRLGLGHNKMFYEFAKPLLAYTIHPFEAHPDIDEILVVANQNEVEAIQKLIQKFQFSKVKVVLEGGKTRQDSCYNGVQACEESGIIMIHDGARPFVTHEIISQSLKDALEFGASVVGVPVKDTTKLAMADGFVSQTLERDKLWQIQTPQTFRSALIREGHTQAKADGFKGTDDASLIERLGHRVKLTMGSYDNIKITTREDLILAEKILGF